MPPPRPTFASHPKPQPTAERNGTRGRLPTPPPARNCRRRSRPCPTSVPATSPHRRESGRGSPRIHGRIQRRALRRHRCHPPSGVPASESAKSSREENGGGAAEICTAAIAASCSAGIAGDGEGQFAESAHLAVGPGGVVHVVDCVGVPLARISCENRLQKFEPSGVFIEELALLTGRNAHPNGVAVDSSGDFYVSVSNAIRKYDPAGNLLKELPVAQRNRLLAIDASDHLFADRNRARTAASHRRVRPGRQHRAPLRLRRDRIRQRPRPLSKAPRATSSAAEADSVFYRAFPPPGPIVVPGPCKTSFLGNSKATLLAEVNPEGKATTVHYEYISDADFDRQRQQLHRRQSGDQNRPRASRSAPTSSSTTPRPRPTWCPKPNTTAGSSPPTPTPQAASPAKKAPSPRKHRLKSAPPQSLASAPKPRP